MKKLGMLLAIYIVVVLSLIHCQSRVQVDYVIQFDQENESMYEVKEEIQEIFNDLISGIQEKSYISMILHNLDRFAYEEDVIAKWDQNRLHIIQGDGKGEEVFGFLEATSVCVESVVRRSFFQELWDWIF